MGNYQGSSPYITSRGLDENGYNDKCYVTNRGVCNE